MILITKTSDQTRQRGVCVCVCVDAPSCSPVCPIFLYSFVSRRASLLYFNSLFGATMMTMVLLRMPDETRKIVEFDGWRNPTFIALYICTSFMGKMQIQPVLLCTRATVYILWKGYFVSGSTQEIPLYSIQYMGRKRGAGEGGERGSSS